ncbi:MAG: putative Adenylyl cyclase CyaB [Candidatus Doudnabacteria bacterium]|nr:putative Adenylyl cyclase CyaB [Candidatus Doudnabacteria bacterium]
MREIEVKARLQDRNKTMKAIKALGCVFNEPIAQSDRIYMLPEYIGLATHQGNVLRIRVQNGKALFTLKRSITNELDCLEKELAVSDSAVMADIIDLLGYKEYAHVLKTRQKSKYKDYEICLDDVEGLGSFIEVEKLVEENIETQEQDKLFEFLAALGISKEDRVMQGYDTLVYNQNHMTDV